MEMEHIESVPVSIMEETLVYDDGSRFLVTLAEYTNPNVYRISIASTKSPFKVAILSLQRCY